jgi:tRNA G18 (ribose-2'-O)-methylase SpoU
MEKRLVVLDSVRSSHNVGAIFRTADAVGVSKIYLAGYTPTPTDRFGRPNEKLRKTALGATATVPWEAASDVLELITSLREAGVFVVAVEQHARAQSLFTAQTPADRPVVYVFGNEIEGVRPEVLAIADIIVDLPMLGIKESLNVAVTAGIALYNDRFGHS